MKAIPGPNNAIADVEQGWPAPYADGRANPWIGPMLSLPMAFALIGYDGRIAMTNDAMSATCGTACRPGVRPSEMFTDGDAERVAAAVARAVAGEGPIELRAPVATRPDEDQVLTLTPVPPGLGVAALLTMRDIREQLRLEKQVAAVTRMQAVGQLAGGIAHDFNNILTVVLALTEQLLDRHSPGDEDYADLDQIRLNGQRAAAMVAQLLAFARQQPRKQEVLDLAATVEALRPLLNQLLGQGISLAIESPRLVRAVRADPGQIEQVVVNLAVNARDAMGGQGPVTIRLADVPAADVAALGYAIMPIMDYIVIEVADAGPGIPAGIAGKIFEPFFSTKPQGQGTGLGLSTVYGIVKQSDGFIFARSNAPHGTVFAVYLPAVTRRAQAQAQANAEPTPAPRPPVLNAPPVAANPARLLLVEDEPGVRAVLVRGLQRAGFDVVAAEGGDLALAMLAAADPPIEVLVSDIMMPGIDGVELARRAARLYPGLGIVLMSGFAEPPLRRAAAARGTHFVAKPFALAELIAEIAAVRPLAVAQTND